MTLHENTELKEICSMLAFAVDYLILSPTFSQTDNLKSGSAHAYPTLTNKKWVFPKAAFYQLPSLYKKSQAARQGQAVLRATADVVRKTEKMANFHAAQRNQFLIDRA